MNSTASLLIFSTHHGPALKRVLHYAPASPLGRGLPSPRSAYPSVSLRQSNELSWYRNINLLSIAYDFCPRLRPRLTLRGRTFLRKPWIFGGQDSHLPLATHANILSCVMSSTPFGIPSALTQCSPTPDTECQAVASVAGFSPGHFRRRTTRLVSYYALFKCMAASKPTS